MRVGQRGQRRAPVDQQLLDDRADRRRTASPGAVRGDRRPRASRPSRARRDDLAAERRLADAGRAAHEQRRRVRRSAAHRSCRPWPRRARPRGRRTPARRAARPPCTGRSSAASRRPGCTPSSRASATRRRSYQRIATWRWPASSAARISSRHAASSVGSTSRSRSQSPLRRSSSAERRVDLAARLLRPRLVGRVGQQLAGAPRRGASAHAPGRRPRSAPLGVAAGSASAST